MKRKSINTTFPPNYFVVPTANF